MLRIPKTVEQIMTLDVYSITFNTITYKRGSFHRTRGMTRVGVRPAEPTIEWKTSVNKQGNILHDTTINNNTSR